MEPSFLIFGTGGGVRIPVPTLPLSLSLTSKEVYFNEVCEKCFMLESNLFPLLMTASLLSIS